ncbi:MAG: dynamin family protein [Terriglobales bacterium]
MTHEPTPAALNEHQQRHLYFSLVQIDKLLADIERIAASAGANNLFPRYVDDLSPAQRKLLEGSIRRLRASMAGLLASQGMKPERPNIEASGAIRTNLVFAVIAAEDLGPRNMRGYGELDEAQAREVEGIIAELHSRVDALLRELTPEPSAQLESRIARLPPSEAQRVLAVLERVTRERGLSEFRAGLSLAASRLAAPAMEIAVFGRVSCGKSSLLNYLLGADLLPTGATPITAVPTRIGYGPEPRLAAQFEREQREWSGPELGAQLAALASEQQNPDNRLGITRLTVLYPSPRLREGVIFVDTPGLGSIRNWGAMETLAYLPRSDMAILLVDAGATLGADELELVRWLQQGGVPVEVLLSKADLVAPADVERGLDFTRQALARAGSAGTKLAVRAVSVRQLELAEAWFAQDIAPMYEALRQRLQQSIELRLAALRDGVLAALEGTEQPAQLDAASRAELERQFRLAEAAADQAGDRLRALVQLLLDAAGPVLEAVSRELAAFWQEKSPHPGMAELQARAGEAIGKAMVDQVRPLLTLLGGVGERFADALAQARRLLPQAAPEASDTSFALRDFPMPEVGPVQWEIPAPRLGALGGRLAGGHFRRVLESRWSELSVALRAYGVLAQQRGQNSLAGMRRQFAAHADIYRAALQRATGERPAAASAGSEPDGPVVWLRRWQPGAEG